MLNWAPCLKNLEALLKSSGINHWASGKVKPCLIARNLQQLFKVQIRFRRVSTTVKYQLLFINNHSAVILLNKYQETKHIKLDKTIAALGNKGFLMQNLIVLIRLLLGLTKQFKWVPAKEKLILFISISALTHNINIDRALYQNMVEIADPITRFLGKI